MFTWIVPFLHELDISYRGNSRGEACKGDASGPHSCSCKAKSFHGWDNIYKDPKDPALLPAGLRTPEMFKRKRIYIWFPELFYPHDLKHMPCASCGYMGADVILYGWNPNVLII